MIGYTPFLLIAAEWELFGRLGGAQPAAPDGLLRRRLRRLLPDRALIARLDVFDRIRLVSSAETPSDVEGLPSRRSCSPGRSSPSTSAGAGPRAPTPWRRSSARCRWASSGPGRCGSPGCGRWRTWATTSSPERRQTVSIWLGLAACGVPGAGAAGLRARPPPARADRRLLARAAVAILREAFVLAMLITLVNEALFINQAVPKFLKFEELGLVKRLVAYPRFIQAWSMFASDAPMNDESVVVEATHRRAGARSTPTARSPAASPPRDRRNPLPPRQRLVLLQLLDADPRSGRLPGAPSPTGSCVTPSGPHNPGDRIVRFDAYRLENDSPPPGETIPRNVQKHIFPLLAQITD